MNPRFLIIPALIAGLQAASAADITGTINLKGTPPPEKENNDIKANADCGKFHTEPVTTHFYVVSPQGGLRDVFITLKGIDAKSTGEAAPAVVLDQKGCEYMPYVIALQTGQKLIVKNSDPVMHNVHPTPTASGNKEVNKAQMPGGADLNFTFPTAEKFLRVKCDVHPWMLAYANVSDNPYYALTDKDGNFKIANVPPGKYTVVATHRKAGTVESKEIEVKGDNVKQDLTLEVKAQ